MQKQITQRQRDERARRKAMPIALIQRPLRHIAARDVHIHTGTDGVDRKVMGPIYKAASIEAACGNGRFVQLQAQAIA